MPTKAKAPKKPGRPALAEVRICNPQVITSDGEKFMGDVVKLPIDEANELIERGSAK